MNAEISVSSVARRESKDLQGIDTFELLKNRGEEKQAEKQVFKIQTVLTLLFGF
jgi:hypothetical protein